MAIRCMVVTPERTELDAEVKFLVLPMYDGELGVAPGRSAMIGRLGYGVLRLQTEQGFQRLFVDGGFAQIENDTVSVLTGKAQPVESLDLAAAETSLEQALSGIDVAFYLFSQRQDHKGKHQPDLKAARHFGEEAKDYDVKRIIYLSALADKAFKSQYKNVINPFFAK